MRARIPLTTSNDNTCYSSIWEVHYDLEKKIETEDRYRLSSEALNKAEEYEV